MTTDFWAHRHRRRHEDGRRRVEVVEARREQAVVVLSDGQVFRRGVVLVSSEAIWGDTARLVGVQTPLLAWRMVHALHCSGYVSTAPKPIPGQLTSALLIAGSSLPMSFQHCSAPLAPSNVIHNDSTPTSVLEARGMPLPSRETTQAADLVTKAHPAPMCS